MNHQFRSQASGDGCSTSSCRRDSGVDASKIPLRTTPGRRLKDSRTVPLQRGAEAISRLHEKSEAGHRMLDTQLETVARKIRRNSIKMGIASFAAGAGPPPRSLCQCTRSAHDRLARSGFGGRWRTDEASTGTDGGGGNGYADSLPLTWHFMMPAHAVVLAIRLGILVAESVSDPLLAASACLSMKCA